jgi:hypothetical protein
MSSRVAADFIDAHDLTADDLNGGTAIDTAKADEDDDLTGIESTPRPS